MTIDSQTLRSMRDEMSKTAIFKRMFAPIIKRVRGAAATAGDDVASGVMKQVKPQIAPMAEEAGEAAAKGVVKGLTPSKKVLAGAGIGGAAGLGGAGYASHKIQKGRERRMSQAVAEGIQRGLRPARSMRYAQSRHGTYPQ